MGWAASAISAWRSASRPIRPGCGTPGWATSRWPTARMTAPSSAASPCGPLGKSGPVRKHNLILRACVARVSRIGASCSIDILRDAPLEWRLPADGLGTWFPAKRTRNAQRDQLLLRDLQEIPGGGGQHLRLRPGAFRARSLERRRRRLQPARGRRHRRRDGRAVVAGDDVRRHAGLAADQSQQQRPDAEPALRDAQDLAGTDTAAARR